MEDKELIALARAALKNSYSPYSKFSVGAALECRDGQVFTGVNIENASYGATICAERAAVCGAVSAGRREYTKIAIVSGDGTFCPPCGICRQVLFEFTPEITVICEHPEKGTSSFVLTELLQYGFGPESL